MLTIASKLKDSLYDTGFWDTLKDVCDLMDGVLPLNDKGWYILVQYPKIHLLDNNIGYPSLQLQDTNALYIPVKEHIKAYNNRPAEDDTYQPLIWPDSQSFLEENPDDYELIIDEKGLADFGASAYWVPMWRQL